MNAQHVLIVDDEKSIQRVLQRVLAQVGCKVTTADDTASARRLLRYHSFDLILCDYLMPGENGLAFLQDMKREYPKTIRVMMTGNGDMQTVIEAINQAQVHFYFTKPFDFKTIRATVEELLGWAGRNEVAGDRPFTTRQRSELANLRSAHPGIDEVVRDRSGAIVLDDAEEFTKELANLLDLKTACPQKTGSDDIFRDEQFLKILEA